MTNQNIARGSAPHSTKQRKGRLAVNTGTITKQDYPQIGNWQSGAAVVVGTDGKLTTVSAKR